MSKQIFFWRWKLGYLSIIWQKEDIPVIFIKNPRVSHFNPHCKFTQHNEFTKAGKFHKNLSSERFIETNNIFAPIHCVRENKKSNRVKINYHTQQNKFQDQTLSWRTFSLNNKAQNGQHAFFQVILDCHISNFTWRLCRAQTKYK